MCFDSVGSAILPRARVAEKHQPLAAVKMVACVYASKTNKSYRMNTCELRRYYRKQKSVRSHLVAQADTGRNWRAHSSSD